MKDQDSLPSIDLSALLPRLGNLAAQAELRPVHGRVRRIRGLLVHASVDVDSDDETD